jgi:hypothetical protein
MITEVVWWIRPGRSSIELRAVENLSTSQQSLNRSRNFPAFINNEVLVQCCEYFTDIARNKEHETEGSLACSKQSMNPGLKPRYPTHILPRNF